MTKKSKTQQVTSLLDNIVEEKQKTPVKMEETAKEEVSEPPLEEVPQSTDEDTNDDGEIVEPVEESVEGAAKPGALASWVTAGTAGLKVAAGVGANLATATAEMTRTSIQKVTDATKNISFASADSIRYTKLYDSFNKEEKTIEITVNAGTFAQIPFFVPKGRAIVWKILVKTLDIGLSFKLRVQELGGAIEHDLEYERKVMAGEYCVGDRKEMNEDRHIVMILNNKLSKLRNKTLVYKVTIAQPEIIAEVKEQYAKEAEEFAAQVLLVSHHHHNNNNPFFYLDICATANKPSVVVLTYSLLVAQYPLSPFHHSSGITNACHTRFPPPSPSCVITNACHQCNPV